MGGKRRDRAAEQAAVTSAAERLLAATPLRSVTGKLTVSELITESGLRRDIVYEHPDLIDTFKARAKAQDAQPAALTALATERDELRGELTAAREDLAREQRTASTLRKVIAELSLELDQAREEIIAAANVTSIRAARNGTLPGSAEQVLPSKHMARCAALIKRPGAASASGSPRFFLLHAGLPRLPMTPTQSALRDRVPPGPAGKLPVRRTRSVPLNSGKDQASKTLSHAG